MSQKLRLDRDYYKGDTRRDINGYNTQTGWWFTGGTSFMSNGYVIYTNGLDDNPPNPTALAQGRTYESRLFDERSTNPRSSYYQFTSQLKTIADRAAANEERYLILKLQQLYKDSNIDVEYLDKIKQAIEQKDYNSAYTLLLRRDKDLEKFRNELNSNRNKYVGRTNEFFNSQFYAFLAEKFEQQLTNQTGAFRTVTLEDNFEDLVDEFFATVFHISVDQNQSLEAIRKDFVRDLEDIASTSGGRIRISTMLKDSKLLYDTAKGSKKITKKDGKEVAKTIKAKQSLVTKKGEYRSVGVLANALAKSLQLYIGNGLSQEIHNIAAGTDIGSYTQSTGGIKKDVVDYLGNKHSVIQQKDDVIMRDIFNAVVPIDQLIQSVYDDDFKDQTKEFHEEVTRRMKQQAEIYNSSEFFEIAVNVKGYTSLHDLQIEGAGSFSAKMGTLSQIQLDGNMVNKLIFMLNNTTNGCIMAGRQSEIEDYLASVCVVWMWDNPQEIFDLDMKGSSNYKKIYLFNSGGSYFTASQIIYQTLERLVNFEDNSNKFVKVGIQPAPTYSGYSDLVKQYSVNQITAKDEWQAMLQKRWDAIKEATMKTGTLSIHFDQRDLEELIGNLRNILNS